MRLGLYAERVLPELVGTDSSVDAKWFSIMGQPPLREVVETALGLPDAFGQVDIDQQLDVFKERSNRILGISDPSEFAEPEILENVINTFLARSQLNSFGAGAASGQIALTLLSG